MAKAYKEDKYILELTMDEAEALYNLLYYHVDGCDDLLKIEKSLDTISDNFELVPFEVHNCCSMLEIA